ncbi:MAG: hypothetical protein SNJ61_12050 [Fimbriimonadaceae bacterium]
MTLNQYAAEIRMQIFDSLKKGIDPPVGTFDASVLKEGKTKGEPQIGTTRYEPETIIFEFIFPDPRSAATVLSVRVGSPERIVFLPVPKWVVESIWQGDVDGSFHFESDAREMLAEFASLLEPDANRALFGPKQATRRE